jgi:hypothetical protein
MKWMERRHRLNPMYFISEIINELITNPKAMETFPNTKWHWLRLDNARIHTSHESVDYIERHKFIRPPSSVLTGFGSESLVSLWCSIGEASEVSRNDEITHEI